MESIKKFKSAPEINNNDKNSKMVIKVKSDMKVNPSEYDCDEEITKSEILIKEEKYEYDHDHDQINKIIMKKEIGNVWQIKDNNKSFTNDDSNGINKMIKSEILIKEEKYDCSQMIKSDDLFQLEENYKSFTKDNKDIKTETSINVEVFTKTKKSVPKQETTLSTNSVNNFARPVSIKVETFLCDLCGRSFSNYNSLKKHNKIHKESSNKKFQCDECPNLFSHCSSMKKHKKTHRIRSETFHPENKKFQCNGCLKSCTNSKIKQSKCDECLKIFVESDDLKKIPQKYDERKSQKILSAKKEFACNLCAKAFSRNDYLICHFKKIHTDKKHLFCDHCPKTFTSSIYLKTHIKKRHGSLKMLQCDKCLKLFSQGKYLKLHKTVHNKDKKNNCDVCSKSFSHDYKLKIHKRTRQHKLWKNKIRIK